MTVIDPTDVQQGYVSGRIILSVGNQDADRESDYVAPSGKVILDPKNTAIHSTSPAPTLVLPGDIKCTVGTDGWLRDPKGNEGVWLPVGRYEVRYELSGIRVPTHALEVTDSATESNPKFIGAGMPLGGLPITPSQYSQLSSEISNLGPADVGAVSLSDFQSHASRHAVGGTDPITPESIGALPMSGGVYDGHVDDAPYGTVYISSGVSWAANGYPWMPDDVGHLTTVDSNIGTYGYQIVRGGSGTTWFRGNRAGWNAWHPLNVDTGWRDISNELRNGWLGTFLFRRVNSLVELRYQFIDGRSATESWFCSLPSSIAPGTPTTGQGTRGTMHFVSGTENQIGRFTGANADWTGTNTDVASATFHTSSPIPDSMPGTPA